MEYSVPILAATKSFLFDGGVVIPTTHDAAVCTDGEVPQSYTEVGFAALFRPPFRGSGQGFLGK